MMENKIHVPNHQPSPFSIAMFDDQGLSFFTTDPTDLHPTMNFVVDGSAFLMPVSEKKSSINQHTFTSYRSYNN
jgi:hypothetical protein